MTNLCLNSWIHLNIFTRAGQVCHKTARLSGYSNSYYSFYVPPNLQRGSSRFFFFCCSPTRAMASSFTRFLNHNGAPQSVGLLWTSDQLVAELPDITQHSQQTSMSPVGFEPMISAGERPHTYALDRAATGTCIRRFIATTIWRTSLNNGIIKQLINPLTTVSEITFLSSVRLFLEEHCVLNVPAFCPFCPTKCSM